MRKESWQFSKHFSFFFFFSSFHLSGYLCVLNKAVMGFLFFFSPFFFLGVSVISAAASVYPYGICLHGCHIKKQSVFYSLPIITLSLKDTGILLSASWAGNRSQTTLREFFKKNMTTAYKMRRKFRLCFFAYRQLTTWTYLEKSNPTKTAENS